jgi:hypothetical protein
MSNSNKFWLEGHARAALHLIVAPVVLFTVLVFIEKTYSLIVPISYLVIISILQYIRLKKAESLKLKIYSRSFFDHLKFQATLLLGLFLILFGIGVMQ